MAPVLASVLVLATLAAARGALMTHRTASAGSRLAALSARRRPKLTLESPSWLAVPLAQVGLDVNEDVAWTGWIAASITSGAGGLMVGGPGLAGFAFVVSFAAPLLAWGLLRHRGQARFEAALPGVVEAIARGLRSGASLRQAVAEAARSTTGEPAGDLARVAAGTEHGATLTSSLEEWARRRPVTGVRLVVAALCLATEMGGATAQAVDGVADTLRQRLAARAEATSLATQARASAAVIAAAPVAFCAVASAADRRTLSFVFRTGPGLALLAAGLVLDAVGALWMARITRMP